MSVSSVQRDERDPRQEPTAAARLLSDLQAAHSGLLAAMAEMDRLAQPPPKSVQELTAARLKMSHASLVRRALIDQACDYLRSRVSETDARALSLLTQERADYQLRSTAHIAHWSVDQIARDWPGYCAASREIRRHMTQSVEAERSVLYAMLQRYRNG